MFDALGGGDDAGVLHIRTELLFYEIVSLGNDSLHALALFAFGGNIQIGKDTLDSGRVFLGLLQMFFEGSAETFRGGRLGHFRQRLNQLIFSIIEVTQLNNEQILQR